MANPLKVETGAGRIPQAGTAQQKASWVAIAFWIALGTGITLRFIELGMRTLHHDESIHATFAYQWLDAPGTSYYKYDPTYHGPFLYIITRILFALFGVGVVQGRLFPLIFGTAVIFTPFFFRQWLGRMGTWAAVLLLAVSPLNIYYSRFLAHDMPSLFFASASLAAFLKYLAIRDNPDEVSRGRRKWLFLSASAMGLLFSVKAVGFLYLFIYLTGGVYVAWLEARRAGRSGRLTLALPEGLFAKAKRREAYLAAIGFCIFYGWIQTSLFHNPAGFIDGLFGRVLSYWWGQHTIERLTGPTTFHLRSMLLHELPICLVLLCSGIAQLKSRRWGKWVLGALFLVFAVTVPVPWKLADWVPQALVPVFQFLKLRGSADIFLYAMCFAFGILGTSIAARDGKPFFAFLTYWTYATLAIYSFAGEKTPWLTLHVMYPAALLAAVVIVGWLERVDLGAWLAWRENRMPLTWRQATVAVVGCLALAYQLRIAYWVNFMTPGEPVDLLSQVHNTKDVKFVVDWMNRVSMETGEKPMHMPISIAGDVVWAFYFYLIENGYKTFTLDTKSVNGSQRFVILDDPSNKELELKLMGWGYRQAKLDHSGWWVPEHGFVSWIDWIVYAWERRPPNPVGLTPLYVYFRPLEVPMPGPPPVVTLPVGGDRTTSSVSFVSPGGNPDATPHHVFKGPQIHP